MTDETASTLDSEYGKRMKVLRDGRGLTQAEVVRRMREHGVNYMNASTLSRIESGARPMRLSEAGVLSDIYKIRLSTFTVRGDGFAYIAKMMARDREARRKYVAFRDLVADLVQEQSDFPGLIRGLDAVWGKSDDEDVQKQLELAKRSMQNFADIDLVAEVEEFKRAVESGKERAKTSSVERFLQSRDQGRHGEHPAAP